jgi:molybdopterin-guanine dinucleotide biosynthesis protein A
LKPLGAILAGGASRRFGADKAMALLAGRPLITHVRTALAPHCRAVSLCGRDGEDGVPDRPAGGRGPLAGLNAALHAAVQRGCSVVLVAPCDTPLLPAPLLAQLAGLTSPAFVAQLPVLGIWPALLAMACEDFLASGGRSSMRAWAERTGAQAIDWPEIIPNINSCDDLTGLTGFFP